MDREETIRDDRKSYEKLATMRAGYNQKKSLLRELLQRDVNSSEGPPTPFRKILLTSAICHTVLGIGGAILLGVLGEFLVRTVCCIFTSSMRLYVNLILI